MKKSGKQVAPARRAAFQVLEEVAKGGYASDLLRDVTQPLTPRDAGLAGQIVFGTLRIQNQLDYLIEIYSGRSVETLDLPVQIALRTAIYQLRYLERIPAHAAVDDAVEFVKQRKRAASGLTNAVLRKTTREPVTWPTEALSLACPAWLLDRWRQFYGETRARAIALAALQEPESFIRIPEGGPIPAALQLEPTSVPGCFKLLSHPVDGIRLHDIGSQAVLSLLDLQPHHTFLDLCSAPGNKAAQALEAGPKRSIACDLSEKRLHSVSRPTQRVVLDATEPLPFALQADRILVDAPCSGTGTLARNPEIKWRLQPPDLIRQQTRQIAILRQAARWLGAGGKVLYITCSLEKEENDAVLEQVLAMERLTCETKALRLPGVDRGDGFFAAILAKN